MSAGILHHDVADGKIRIARGDDLVVVELAIAPRRMSAAGGRRHAGAERVVGF